MVHSPAGEIESKFLDPDQELKRIFGSAAVNEAQSGNRNRNPHRNRPVRSGTIIRNAVPGRMSAGRGGLSMSEDEKRNNGDIMWWRFTHNKDYQETQEWEELFLLERLSPFFSSGLFRTNHALILLVEASLVQCTCSSKLIRI